MLVGGHRVLPPRVDVDFAEMRDETTQTDEQRRIKQIGIGLTSGQSIGGPE